MTDGEKTFVAGMRAALLVVERRRAHYERYRCRCSRSPLSGSHRDDCPARWMETKVATLAVLDEAIALIEAAIERVERGGHP